MKRRRFVFDLAIIALGIWTAFSIRGLWQPPGRPKLRCPAAVCTIVKMRDGSLCRVWNAPRFSARPERWTCP